MEKILETNRAIAFAAAFVMATASFVPAQTVLAASGQLDAPVVSQTSGTAGAAGPSPVSREVSWESVNGAVSYDLYVFDNLADARAGDNAVARVNIPHPASGDITLDFRQITFTEIDESGAIYGPEVVNDANFVRGLHTSGNLRPGAYWIRVRAVASNASDNSELSDLAQNRQFASFDLEELPIVIALGPSEAREIMETRFNEIGSSLRLIDLRPNVAHETLYYEFWTEGFIRFFDERLTNIHWSSEEQTQPINPDFMTDEEVFEALPDLDATILLL